MIRPAEPTLERVERFYALLNDVQAETEVKLPPPPVPEEPPRPAGIEPQTIAGILDEADRQQRVEAEPVLLDPAALCRALFQRGRLRQLAAVVCVKDDGSPITDEEAGAVTPGVLNAAVVPFMMALASHLAMWGSTAGAEGFGLLPAEA